MSQDLLIPSNIAWFRNDAENVMNHIAEATYGTAHIGPAQMFRPDEVHDVESRRVVPTAAQRLIRWDVTPVSTIFPNGFVPRVSPTQGTYPANAFNLATYVQSNTPSIFVSTTHYTRTADGVLHLWQRRLTQANSQRFAYEIFAYGGIDVNHVFGNHDNANQNEIAFPGGIRSEFIRSAREYQGTRVVAIWTNPNFNPGANAQHSPTWADLPPYIQGPGIPDYEFTEYESGLWSQEGDLRRRRDTSASDEDLMHGPGEQTVDEFLVSMPVSRLSRACFPDPNSSGRAYFFAGNQYVVINFESKKINDTIAWGPKPILGNWPSLVKARFGKVDAILLNPDNKKEEAYFFYGSRYVRIKINLGTTDDFIVDGPNDIVNDWPSLKQAGFEKVDAVLPNPKDSDGREAYFFSGKKYVLIKINPKSNDAHIINGPKIIVDEWPSLKQANFDTVDVVLPNPSNSDEAYFFSGRQYALIDIQPRSNNDKIIIGPKDVAENWPSLHKALFY